MTAMRSRRLAAGVVVLASAFLLSGCVGSGVWRPDYARSFSDDRPTDATEPRDQAKNELQLLAEKPQLLLEDVLRLADLKNPDIASARAQIGVSAGRLWQAELYPNPTLSLEAESIATRNPSLGRSENTISITQPIIIGGRRRAAIEAASAERLRDIVKVDDVRRRVLGDVRSVFLELLFLANAERLGDELIELARQTHAVAVARFEERAAPESESLKSQVELERLQLARRSRAHQRSRTLRRLHALLGDDALAAERLVGDLPTEFSPLNLSSLLAAVERDHPRILAAKKDVDAALHRFDSVEAARVPDLGLRFAYGHDGDLGEDIFEAGIEMEIPLFNRNQGRIVEARYEAIKARQRLVAVRAALAADVAAAHADYLEAQDQAQTFARSIIPAAEKALSQARDGYQAGRQSFLDILDAQRTLSEARFSQLEGRMTGGLAQAKLIGLLGPLNKENSR